MCLSMRSLLHHMYFKGLEALLEKLLLCLLQSCGALLAAAVSGGGPGSCPYTCASLSPTWCLMQPLDSWAGKAWIPASQGGCKPGWGDAEVRRTEDAHRAMLWP